MGFENLHQDPNKREKESFLSEDFDRKIEERAKAKAHLAWARNQSRATNLSRGSLHENPPSKSLGGGGTASRGRGRGSNQDRGKGRGKGGKGDRSSSAKP